MSLTNTFATTEAFARRPMADLDTNFAEVGKLTVIPCTATGTNLLTLTPFLQCPEVVSYQNTQLFSFVAENTSTAPVGAILGSLTTLAVYMPGGTVQASVNDIGASTFYVVAYLSALNTGAGGFEIIAGIPITAFGRQVLAATAAADLGTLIGLIIASGKTVTFNNTLTFAGTDATTLTFQGTGTVVNRDSTDTLTNKTLTAPVIATIVNTGTLTLPSSTDTLVGKATTDTLTNKTLTAPAINGGTHTAITGLGIRSTGAAFDLTMASAEVLTAGRTLNWVVGDGARTITLGGNITTTGAFAMSGAFGLTLTVTGATSVTFPTSGTLVNSAVATLSSLTSIGTIGTGVWQGTKVGLAYGGTNADLSATGGTSQVLKQVSSGAAVTVGQLAFTDLAGSVAASQMPALTGDVTTSAGAVATTLANNAVTLAKMATMATASFHGRNTAGTGNVEVLSATTATAILNAMVGDSGSGGTKGLVPAPSAGDAAAVKFLKADGTWATPGGAGTVTSVATGAGLKGGTITSTGTINITSACLPQGRLTLTSAAPVLIATVSASATIYYALYNGNLIPISTDGSTFTLMTFAELSNATAQSSTGSAGPAAVANNSNYDLFVWSSGGTTADTLTRGPAWTSDTARGTGAGTTELQRLNGVWTNKIAITNGPAANRGTYVGTVRSNGSATIDFILGGTASGGTAAVLGVWNMYNRLSVSAAVQDTTDSWTYAGTTWRSANGSATMRVSYVMGLQEDPIRACYNGLALSVTATTAAYVGVGYDVTNALSGTPGYVGSSLGILLAVTARYTTTSLGFHFMQAIENADAASATFKGDAGAPTLLQSGLWADLRM